MELKKLPKTKIVCTIGPSSSNKEMLEKFFDAGMNVARLNFSHGSHEIHAQNISLLNEIAKEKNKTIAILQDLQGPKIRVGKLINDKLILTKQSRVILKYGLEQTDEKIPIDYKELSIDVKEGADILIDDGLMSMKVEKINSNGEITCEVTHGGVLKSRKGVNFPNCLLSIPATTEKDIRDLLFGVSQGVDYIALSFVQKADDIRKLKMIIRALGSEIPVISKIEMLQAIQHINEICEVSDGIMVARGDLGVECGFARVAVYQKRIIEAALQQGKPVIVATQMLDSMIESRRPTKAEICDVANAVFDHADATMLSGESASGKYPDLSISVMRDILNKVDRSKKVDSLYYNYFKQTHMKITPPEILAQTASEIADRLKCAAIICLTLTGQFARYLAKYRPHTPIIAFSPRHDVIRKISLIHGVQGILNHIFYDTDTAFTEIGKYLAKKELVKKGDLIIITGGIPVSQMNPTNTIKIHRISENDFL